MIRLWFRVGARAGLWVVAVSLLAALAGCPRKQERSRPTALTFISVEVVDRTRQEDRPPGLSREVLIQHARKQLAASPFIELADEAEGPGAPKAMSYRFKMELGIGEGHAEEAKDRRKLVLVSARATPRDELDGVQLQSSVVAPLPADTSPAELRNKVLEVLTSVLRDIGFQASLAAGDEARIVKALADKDPERLAAAIEIAAVRRVKPAVPDLIKLLKHKEERLADRAIGALVAIGDQRAVKPLTRLTRFQDTAKMAKIIDGIGALGGKEARAYLEFVSSGHEDPDIRNLAAEALARMKQRSGMKKASP